MADNNDDIQIEPGSLVSLHFSLALTDGHVIDSNFAAPAAKFRLGDGNMLPGFEAVLIGLKPGQELETILEPEQAFGVVNPRNQHRFPVAKFKNLLEDELISTEVGAVVSFKDAAGFSLPGVIAEISDQTIAVDFNHPLAGKRIVFKANIVAVLPADVAGVEVKP
ncbi:MAG TPA: peptidylprolyl isomerase [Gammaproteobacteria bacterium]|nr:peptidylprolyl isomerase [Gammaproteobacteria bacterium]HAT25442.1 peptidylprolyl isomerase [Gammaproteobacteria bacterium]HIF86886.1 peptidylprolyl isomerase [Gammaproteobacteria bacterium]HIL62822.1 peptidylprolyl isomerase [Porticoccaceae bacterium]